MQNISVLIAAAGKGSRAGLPYPKTLFPIKKQPILLRLLEVLAPYDKEPTIIVSPDGYNYINKSLKDNKICAHLTVQKDPKGMGDAVLCFKQSPAYQQNGHILLSWGDIPFLQYQTILDLVESHLSNNNDFTFVSKEVKNPYTLVQRDSDGCVMSVIETREYKSKQVAKGEREIGLFIFKKNILSFLNEELKGKYGTTTGEHGFLYIIKHLVDKGFKVDALPIATDLDLVSLNSMEDIDGYL